MKPFLSQSIGVLGLALAFSGLIVFGIRPDLAGVVTLIEAGALLCLGVYFVRHFEVLKAFSTRRSTWLGANSLFMILLFLVILSIVNFILARHSHRFDLSENQKFTLAPQTVKVLKNLQQTIQVTGFFQEGSRSRSAFEDLIKTYRHHSDQVHFDFIDPDRRPAVAKQYGITQYSTVVLETGQKESRIPPVAGQVTEESLTNALIRVSRDDRKVIYFLTGHGEHDTEETGTTGLSTVKEGLEREGFEVKSLMILQQGEIPDDASLLVLAGPRRPLHHAELEAVRGYLDRRGQLFLMLDPQDRAGLEELLAGWGVALGNEIIVSANPSLMLLGFDASNALVMDYAGHEIVKDLSLPTLFPAAGSIHFESEAESKISYQFLARTGADSWGETDFSQRDVRFDLNQDIRGPLDIAGVLEFHHEAINPEASEGLDREAQETNPRVVLVSDSDFSANGTINFSGNSDLFFSIVHWLVQEQDLISMRPKDAPTAPLTLTRTQAKVFFYIPVVAVPTLIIAFGFGIWRGRKRL